MLQNPRSSIPPSTHLGCLSWSLGNPMPVRRAPSLVLRGDIVTTSLLKLCEAQLDLFSYDAIQ